jgi:hypothetical protein
MRAPAAPVRIRLRSLPASAGLGWIRRGFRTFWRRPFGFCGLYMFVVACVCVSMVISPLATLVLMPLLPLISLGFMQGAEDVLDDLPLRANVFWTPLTMSPQARRALLNIGLVYMGTAVCVALFADWLDGGEATRWMEKMMVPRTDGKMPELPPLSGLGVTVMLLKTFGVALVSIPLWHAPALVHWGRQGVAQAMFSSAVSIWRTRGAFLAYVLGWIGVGFAFLMVLTLLVAAFGAAVMTLPAFTCLVGLTTTFYVSIWFGFVDTFEIEQSATFRTVMAAAPPPA